MGKVNKIVCPVLKKGGAVICDTKFETEQVNGIRSNKKKTIWIQKDGEKVEKVLKVEILVGEKYNIIAVKKEKKKVVKVKLGINVYGQICYGWFPIKYKKKSGRVETILSPVMHLLLFVNKARR